MIKQLFLPFFSYKYLFLQLTTREIKARYKQSVMGYAWVLLNPLSQILVYSFVFSVIFRFSTGTIPYPIFLFSGLLPWIYFQTSLAAATLSLVDNSELLKKIYFPREIFLYSVISAKAVDLLFASLILVTFLFIFKVPVQPTVIFILPLFFVQVVLMAGLSLIFAAFNLFYRDIQYLVNLLLLLWLYLTPIIYPLSLVPEKYLWLYNLNPMVGIIEGYRAFLFGFAYSTEAIIESTIISLVIFILGYYFFKRNERVFADVV